MKRSIFFPFTFLSGCILFMFISNKIHAQQVDVENLKDNFSKKNLLKVNGGLSANLVTYNGNSEANRVPYFWNIGGNINFKLFKVLDLPFSVNLTNAGSNLNLPTSPNRIGVHPHYKSLTGHFGDVNMTFSPYTLNGHQFSGAGLDFAPKGGLKMSAMYGRFQKSVEFDSTNKNTAAAYKRFGYGARIGYEKTGYSFGLNMFTAYDRVASLQNKPDMLEIYPQHNLVTSATLGLKPIKGIDFTSEYAISALTKDIRDTTSVTAKSGNVLSGLIGAKNSTAYYKAFKFQINLTIKKSTLGFGYERIDPGYKTLGAYFFANDLEKFTTNFASVFFKNKLAAAINMGIQRDDLNNDKSGKNLRFVGAANVNINPSAKVAIALSYSNFQNYMNIKSQFQFINQLNQLQSLDSLKFTQISQNANININYMFQMTTALTQGLNLNLSFQDASSTQGNVSNVSGSSQFYNGALAHNIGFNKIDFNISTGYNFTYNTIALDHFITQGPTVVLNKKWYKRKITTGLTTSYNVSTSSNKLVPKIYILNIRLGVTYNFYKNHNFNLSVMNQSKFQELKTNMNSVIGNLGYSFNF